MWSWLVWSEMDILSALDCSFLYSHKMAGTPTRGLLHQVDLSHPSRCRFLLQENVYFLCMLFFLLRLRRSSLFRAGLNRPPSLQRQCDVLPPQPLPALGFLHLCRPYRWDNWVWYWNTNIQLSCLVIRSSSASSIKPRALLDSILPLWVSCQVSLA